MLGEIYFPMNIPFPRLELSMVHCTTAGKLLNFQFCGFQVFRTHPYLFQLDFVETRSITRKSFSVINVQKILSNSSINQFPSDRHTIIFISLLNYSRSGHIWEVT